MRRQVTLLLLSGRKYLALRAPFLVQFLSRQAVAKALRQSTKRKLLRKVLGEACSKIYSADSLTQFASWHACNG